MILLKKKRSILGIHKDQFDYYENKIQIILNKKNSRSFKKKFHFDRWILENQYQ